MKKIIIFGFSILLFINLFIVTKAASSQQDMPMILTMPKPNYPPEAKKAGAKGKVGVQVSVNTEGNVTNARVVSGHKLLHKAAKTAAMKATFEPKIVNGKAVSFTQLLVYNFGGQ